MDWEVSIKDFESSCLIFDLILKGRLCNPEFSSVSEPTAVHVGAKHYKGLVIISTSGEL